MIKSESFNELPKAFLAFQKKIKDPTKDADNPFMKSKYVPFDGLVAAVRPTLNECGLAFTQEATAENGAARITTTLWHESGEFLQAEPLSLNLTKADPQGIGSAITYGKRYSLQALLGVAWEDDDDGNAASDKAKTAAENNKRHELLTKIANTAKSEQLNAADIGKLMKYKYGKTTSKELTVEQLADLAAHFAEYWTEFMFDANGGGKVNEN